MLQQSIKVNYLGSHLYPLEDFVESCFIWASQSSFIWGGMEVVSILLVISTKSEWSSSANSSESSSFNFWHFYFFKWIFWRFIFASNPLLVMYPWLHFYRCWFFGKGNNFGIRNRDFVMIAGIVWNRLPTALLPRNKLLYRWLIWKLRYP